MRKQGYLRRYNMTSRFLKNRFYQSLPDWHDQPVGSFQNSDIRAFHRTLPGYTPTPLVSLPGLAARLGVGALYVKDESHRFKTNAFKPLGASYAIFRCLQREWERRFGTQLTPEAFQEPATMAALGATTFCGATDGNHGHAVAWTARMLKQKAVIYMPEGSARSRVDRIEAEGARVVIVPGTFDDCVARADADAKEYGYVVIADTAYPGYMTIPNDIMAGYSTIFHEADAVLSKNNAPGVDVVMLQTGVGGLTAAGAWFYTSQYRSSRPRLVSVEPTQSDCFLESALTPDGEPACAKGSQNSIMAGLNCGMPSLLAWPVIRDSVDIFLAIDDPFAEDAMRALAAKHQGDPAIVSGESGASGFAGLLALLQDPELHAARQALKLDKTSRVLIINSEGDTDPVNYQRIVSNA